MLSPAACSHGQYFRLLNRVSSRKSHTVPPERLSVRAEDRFATAVDDIRGAALYGSSDEQIGTMDDIGNHEAYCNEP